MKLYLDLSLLYTNIYIIFIHIKFSYILYIILSYVYERYMRNVYIERERKREEGSKQKIFDVYK